jgi:hypothetical protein
MKGLVKTIAFLIFQTHIMYEGHIYLFNPLKQFMDQYLQPRVLPKNPKNDILKLFACPKNDS